MTPQQDLELFRRLQDWLADRDRFEAPLYEAAKAMKVMPETIRNIAGPDGYNQLGIANYEGVEFVYADGE